MFGKMANPDAAAIVEGMKREITQNINIGKEFLEWSKNNIPRTEGEHSRRINMVREVHWEFMKPIFKARYGGHPLLRVMEWNALLNQLIYNDRNKRLISWLVYTRDDVRNGILSKEAAGKFKLFMEHHFSELEKVLRSLVGDLNQTDIQGMLERADQASCMRCGGVLLHCQD